MSQPKQRKVSRPALGIWKPTLQHTVLPGCRSCGTKHPLANNPPIQSDVCLNPECGKPVLPPGLSVTVAAKGGLIIWFANCLLRLARRIVELSDRIP